VDAGIIAADVRPDFCFLPPEHGFCDAAFDRYYFDPQTERCQPFVWGGCEGNQNRFETEQACLDRCGAQWELYLTEPAEVDHALIEAMQRDFEVVSIQPEPLLSTQHLRLYNWDTSEITLNQEGIDRLNDAGIELLSEGPVGFVVVANGERIFFGVFWPIYFSSLPTSIAAFYTPEDGTVRLEALSNVSYYDNVITHARIYLALQRAGLVVANEGFLHGCEIDGVFYPEEMVEIEAADGCSRCTCSWSEINCDDSACAP
jgi:hypothetical protein